MEIDSVDTVDEVHPHPRRPTFPVHAFTAAGLGLDWGNTGDSQQVSFIESGNTRMGINGDATVP